MPQLPSDISFEQWVTYVFDHQILEPEWWFQTPRGTYDPMAEVVDPTRTLSFLTRLFNGPAFLRDQFTHAQIDQGLNFLVSTNCSNHMYIFSDSNLRWPSRCSCIAAMYVLFHDLMAPLYQDDLAHLHTGKEDREHPNYSCYMWWDMILLCPLEGGADLPDRGQINEAVLRVFKQTLLLPAEACMESALHGLGHWREEIPERTDPIVRDFLLSRQGISSALRRYAERVAAGDTL